MTSSWQDVVRLRNNGAYSNSSTTRRRPFAPCHSDFAITDLRPPLGSSNLVCRRYPHTIVLHAYRTRLPPAVFLTPITYQLVLIHGVACLATRCRLAARMPTILPLAFCQMQERRGVREKLTRTAAPFSCAAGYPHPPTPTPPVPACGHFLPDGRLGHALRRCNILPCATTLLCRDSPA